MKKKHVSGNRIRLIVCLVFLVLAFQPVAVFGEIRHLSAGVAESGREARPEYPLKLQFALHSGDYLADVQTEFFKDGKTIGRVFSPGPWLYVDLPPGSYAVVATLPSGKKQGASFTIEEKKQTVVILSWKEE